MKREPRESVTKVIAVNGVVALLGLVVCSAIAYGVNTFLQQELAGYYSSVARSIVAILIAIGTCSTVLFYLVSNPTCKARLREFLKE